MTSSIKTGQEEVKDMVSFYQILVHYSFFLKYKSTSDNIVACC